MNKTQQKIFCVSKYCSWFLLLLSFYCVIKGNKALFSPCKKLNFSQKMYKSRKFYKFYMSILIV